MPAAECSIVPGITSYYTVHCTVQVKGTWYWGRRVWQVSINQNRENNEKKERNYTVLYNTHKTTNHKQEERHVCFSTKNALLILRTTALHKLSNQTLIKH